MSMNSSLRRASVAMICFIAAAHFTATNLLAVEAPALAAHPMGAGAGCGGVGVGTGGGCSDGESLSRRRLLKRIGCPPTLKFCQQEVARKKAEAEAAAEAKREEHLRRAEEEDKRAKVPELMGHAGY